MFTQTNFTIERTGAFIKFDVHGQEYVRVHVGDKIPTYATLIVALMYKEMDTGECVFPEDVRRIDALNLNQETIDYLCELLIENTSGEKIVQYVREASEFLIK